MVGHILGVYRTEEALLNQLHQRWDSADCTIICAMDGGLKDRVGTSSYAILFPDNLTPIVTGRAGEWQPRENASSTRQELLGQLGIEYWLTRLETQWGRPRHGVQITPITDSQASIEIMDNIPKMLGIKDTLRPELDVALEIFQQRTSHPWAKWNICKVESHIERDEAPNTFHWECNNYVDAEATRARIDFPLHVLQKRPDYIFPGAMVGCKIDGRIVNNGLHEAIKHHLTVSVLRSYLMEKYHWTEPTFLNIAWLEHHKALKILSLGQKATVLKYIHGWLATKRHRHREGYSPNELCAMCSQPENRLHIFRCSHPQVKSIRNIAWKKLLADLGQNTDASFQAVFQAGLDTVIGSELPTNQAIMEWPGDLRDAFEKQLAIGWDQILFGRIAQNWDSIAQYRPSGGSEVRPGVWTRRAVKLGWQFGLDCWKVRNKVVDGMTSGVSVLEKERVKDIIHKMYRQLLPEIPRRHQEILNQTEEEVTSLPYPSQVAWLGHLKFLHPDKFNEVLHSERGLNATEIPVSDISWSAILGGQLQ